MQFKLIACATSLLSLAAAQSLKSVISSHPSLTILHSLLLQFDLLDSFNSASNITLLAPTDQAYRDLAKWGFNVSQVEPQIAKALLTYHVLDGAYPAKAILAGQEPKVVHTLLRPPILTNVTQGAAIKLSRSGRGQQTDIVLESGLQVITGVVDSDIGFDSGVVHTLNSSLVLPHNISTTAVVGGLTEFLDLMEVAGAVPALEQSIDMTIFIPSNAALQRLRGLLAMLTPAQLANVVGYHAIPGKVLYHECLQASDASFDTVQGTPVRIHTDAAGRTYVNDAQLVRQDLNIYGGVAHIIDNALIPDTDATKTLVPPDLISDQMVLPSLVHTQPGYYRLSSTGSSLEKWHVGLITGTLGVLCLVIYVGRKRRQGQAPPPLLRRSSMPPYFKKYFPH